MRERGAEVGIILAVITTLAFVIWWGVHQEREREEFIRDHHCRKVAETSGRHVHTSGFDSKGNYVSGSAYVSGTTSWLCDDGVTYTW